MTIPLLKMGDLVETLDITPRTIRHYDQLGLLPNSKRSDGNTRLFDNNDIQTIKDIRHLQQSQLMPLEQIKAHLFPPINTQSPLLLTDELTHKTTSLEKTISVCSLTQLKAKKHPLILFFYTQTQKSPHEALKTTHPHICHIPLPEHSLTNYALSIHLPKAIQKASSLQECHRIISSTLNLGYSLALLDNIPALFPQSSNKTPHPFSHLSNPFYPLFYTSQHTQKIQKFLTLPKFDPSPFLAHFTQELLHRKRYISTLYLFHTGYNSQSTQLKNALHKVYPNIPINCIETKHFNQYSKSYIILSAL